MTIFDVHNTDTVRHKSNDLGLKACCVLSTESVVEGFTYTWRDCAKTRASPRDDFFFFVCVALSVFIITSCTVKRITLIATACTIQHSQKHLLIAINGNFSNQSSTILDKYHFFYTITCNMRGWSGTIIALLLSAMLNFIKSTTQTTSAKYCTTNVQVRTLVVRTCTLVNFLAFPWTTFIMQILHYPRVILSWPSTIAWLTVHQWECTVFINRVMWLLHKPCDILTPPAAIYSYK